MCGIFVYISRRGRKVERESIIRAGNKMKHRGPDAEGVFVHDWVGMFHARLSVIDLSKEANQPMFSQDKRFVIVYNGEVYNYKELRKELTDQNVNFMTQSDTEVILNSYIKFSSGCINRFRGMFSFVIVDFLKKEVIAARDHFGIKPLYIYKSGDFIILSSEIKPISEFVELEPNYANYFEQIMFRYAAGTNTGFKNIYRLMPGKFYSYKRNTDDFKESTYYRLGDTFHDSKKHEKRSEQDIINETEDILVESIKIHTYSDVGYNLQLSGGIDSSLIAAILSKKCNCSQLNSFSITLADKRYDESYYQNIVADLFGLKNCQIEITNELFSDMLEDATLSMEMPIVHLGCVCLFYLTKHSSLDSKVVLTGEGADEVFGGYSWYNIPSRLKFYYMLYNLGFSKAINPFRNLSSSLEKIYSRIEHNPLLAYTSLWNWEELGKLLNSECFLTMDLHYRESLLTKAVKKDMQSLLLYYDQLVYLPSLLERQDKMSMASSVEARVPYCDYKVYQFVNSIPNSLKFKDGKIKYLLKKISEKYLPGELVHRRKKGLTLPIDRWLRDKKFLGRYLDMLVDRTTRKRGIYNVDYVNRMVKMHREGEVNFSRRLMVLIMFELWHRAFFDSK